MPPLHKREKVLVQYRLLKDFDELARRGIPGIDVRVMEDNIYEWHVTMSPISGHFAGLRLHLILLFPEDYPRRPPKVELCTQLPHANVFRDFLSWCGYFSGYQPQRGTYVICTDLLEDKPPPLHQNDSRRYDGWSVAYSVESVLVQLQCLLFDDYVQSESGNHINTLWDSWFSKDGNGRKRKSQIVASLHAAQEEADEYTCQACGYSGWNDKVAFYDRCPEAPPADDGDVDEEDDDSEEDQETEEGEGAKREKSKEEGEEDGEEQGEEEKEKEENEKGEQEEKKAVQGEEQQTLQGVGDVQPWQAERQGDAKQTEFVSRKKQRERDLARTRKAKARLRPNFAQQKVYLEIANSNSALKTGHALRRVPGVFKRRDVVSFYFHGVEDEAYVNGHRCINANLKIFNYGHEVEFPWCTFDILTGKKIYRKTEPKEEEQKKERNQAAGDWQRFVNSQEGGSALKPEDTPGTALYVKKREKFHAVGVIEGVEPYQGVVNIVVAGSDGKMGAVCGSVTMHGPYAWNSTGQEGGMQATLYKNVPLEKVRLHGHEHEVIPYEHEPPLVYKPVPGSACVEDKHVDFDIDKDLPVQLVKLLEEGESSGLTRRKLRTLPEDVPTHAGGQADRGGGATEQSFELVDGRATAQSFEIVDGRATEQSSSIGGEGRGGDAGQMTEYFEIFSVLGDEAEETSLLGGATVQSFDVISVVEPSDGDSASVRKGSGKKSFEPASSFHLVPTTLCYEIFSRSSSGWKEDDGCSVVEDAAAVLSAATRERHQGGKGLSDSQSSVCETISNHSVLSLWNRMPVINSCDSNNSWELMKVLCRLNVPIRGFLKSNQDFGSFITIDATPRVLAIRNQRLLPTGKGGQKASDKGKSKGKGAKGKGKGGGADKVLQDGLLPCQPYMRPFWPPAQGNGQAGSNASSSSVMVSGNLFDDLATEEDSLSGPREIVVYVSEVEVERRRLKLSLQPRLSFEDLRPGAEYSGIVVDCRKQNTLGLFVALSDELVGLVHRSQFGAGEFADCPDGDEWGYRKRSVYRVGDRVTVWLLRKEVSKDTGSTGPRWKRRFNIDLTMDPGTEELRGYWIDGFLQVLDEAASDKQVATSDAEERGSGKTAMELQLEQTYVKEDKFFLLKNNRLIQEAQSCYPDLVIDYTTDPPPPPPKLEKPFDFSLIQNWSVRKISEEHKRLTEKREAFAKATQQALGDSGPRLQNRGVALQASKGHSKENLKPLSKQEERLLLVLQKKVEQWGEEYYANITKKIEDHQKRIKEIHDKIRAERDKYPYKSIIDLDKFRELIARVKESAYDDRCCFVTRLSYKEDVLGVGLEIRQEEDTGRNVFYCSFDLLSKEGFVDFGVRTGVWKDKIQFWMPAAIDASHFRRALPFLADCFKELGDGRVEKLTRSYGTQAGSEKYNLKAQLREAERSGQKLMSLDDYRKDQAERKKKLTGPSEPASGNELGADPRSGISSGITEQDVSFGLEVLPKLMNLQTVQLMKGDLHLSTKALEGYMGFHHLLLSILRQFPKLQSQVEKKVAGFLRDDAGRAKAACPNIGEFLCLLTVSRKYTWDDVSRVVLKETLDRNAGWAIDKFPVLAKAGTSTETRLEKTFKASIVSIRLLCFNVWFVRNIVFKRYGEASTVESIIADRLHGRGSCKNLVDKRWEEYESTKGIPKAHEVNMLQEHIKKMMHGDGLNSWHDYFVCLNLKPLKANELSQLLKMSLNDAVRKGYIPIWKMRQLSAPKPVKQKAAADDHMGRDVDKYDDMFKSRGGGDKWW